MNELSISQKLDKVLRLFVENEKPYQRKTDKSFTNEIMYTLNIGKDEAIALMRKICNDGYVYANPIQDNNTNFIFHRLTVDGLLFWENIGGYESKALREDNAAKMVRIELKRHQDIDARLVSNTSRLNWYTLLLAIGTFALVLAEICKR